MASLGTMNDWTEWTRRRGVRVVGGLVGIGVIATFDRLLSAGIPLALLYLLPVGLMSTALERWQIPLLGLLCTYVAEFADAYPWTVNQGVPRDTLYFLAYTAAGLYVREVISRREAEAEHTGRLESEIVARQGAEEQLRLVLANSSIAILTSDEVGTILQANGAAERLFAGDGASEGVRLEGASLGDFLPSLARVQIRRQGWMQLRTMMQCQGMRADREPFLADVWMSSYVTSRGGRLTAMIVDASKEVRDREEAHLEQVLSSSKLALGGLLHEIRNICAAIGVVQQNLLSMHGAAVETEDFDALRQLVTALERMASTELALVKRQPTKLNVGSFLRELQVIVAPSLREAGIALEMTLEETLPEVWADSQSLLQVFLNLIRNAERALEGMEEPRIRVTTQTEAETVSIRFCDNGPGVQDAGHLFRPFEAGSTLSGLGLYLSRAMMTSFRGDLQYVAGGPGSTFVVELLRTGVLL